MTPEIRELYAYLWKQAYQKQISPLQADRAAYSAYVDAAVKMAALWPELEKEA